MGLFETDGKMKVQITDEIIDLASKAYAEKRHPSRWDGEPWGEAGRINHRKAIKNALEVTFKALKD